MSFDAVPPSTTVLNGYNDAGESAATAYAAGEAQAKADAKAAIKAKSKKAKKAKLVKADTPVSPLLQSTAPPMIDQTVQPSPIKAPNALPTSTVIFAVVLPLILWGILIRLGYLQMIKWCAKNTDSLRYAHLHKRHHPGKMKPRVFSK